MCFLRFSSVNNIAADAIAINEEIIVPELFSVQSVNKIPTAGKIEA